MDAKLYQMPFSFDTLMQRNRELPACNLGTSIAQNIFLIISSKYNEHRFDPQFGCEIWDKDFETITNPIVWQEEVNRSIVNSLGRYETRLERLDVDTVITEQPYMNPVTRVHSIKKKIIVNVKGVIKATGEPFVYSPQLFISPISID
jgi:phage baseplate assembly protein W